MSDAPVDAVARLQAGETVVLKPHGKSMEPLISSGDRVTVEPVAPGDLAVDDVVLCRVAGVLRLHKITAIDRAKQRVQIGNNHGHINGWTGYAKVYGRRKRTADA